MEDEENVVTEVTENTDELAVEKLVDGSVDATEEVEQPSEETYTKDDIDKLVNEKLNEILPRKIERAKAKIERQYEEKYGRTEAVLNAGLGTQSIEEATKQLVDFYTDKGIEIPTNTYSSRDLDLLANAEANEIISNGDYDELVEETERLAKKGVENMTPREKIVFTKLAAERNKQDQVKELQKIGVGQDILNKKEFTEFTSKLNPNLSIKEKYELYEKFNPKPKVEPIGSMKTTAAKVDNYKEYYTPDEVRKLTSKDLDDPKIMAAVEKSMTAWEQNK